MVGWRHYWYPTGRPLQVHDLITDRKWVWIAAKQGVIRLDQLSLEYELFSHTNTTPDISLDSVYTLALDDQGRLWAGGSYGLVRYSDDQGWKVIYTGEPVTNFALDDEGNLWRFTFYSRTPAQAYRFQGQDPPAAGDWTPEHVAYQNAFRDSSNWRLLALYGESARKVLKDANGDEWSCSSNRSTEIVIYRNNSKAQRISLRYDRVNAIATTDVQPGIWIGLQKGLFYSDGQVVKQYRLTTDKIAVNQPLVHSIAFTSDGSGWVATSEGLFHFNTKTDEWENIAEVTPNIPLERSDLITVDHRDGLWALGSDYLAHFDGQKWEQWPIPRSFLRCEFQLRAMVEFQGNLWVAADDCGLWRFGGQGWDSVLPFPIASMVQYHNEKLYVSDKHSNVYVYDGIDWRQIPDCAECKWLYPFAITVDASSLWMVGHNSIWRYSVSEGWCNTLTLLVDSPLNSIHVDTDNDLWFADHYNGVLKHCDQKGCELWKWNLYDENQFDPAITAMTADAQGRIWVGGWGLLSVYDPAAER